MREKRDRKTRLIKKNEAEELGSKCLLSLGAFHISKSLLFVSASVASVSAVLAVSSTTSAPEGD